MNETKTYVIGEPVTDATLAAVLDNDDALYVSGRLYAIETARCTAFDGLAAACRLGLVRRAYLRVRDGEAGKEVQQ